MKRRIANLKGADLRRALDYLAQGLHHFRIGVTAITVRILFFIPQTDGDSFPTTWGDEREFVLEAFLPAKQGKGVFLDHAGKLRDAIGLEADGETASKHVNLLGCGGLRGVSQIT